MHFVKKTVPRFKQAGGDSCQSRKGRRVFFNLAHWVLFMQYLTLGGVMLPWMIPGSSDLFEFFQVLGHRGLCQRDFLHNVSTKTGVFLQKQKDDAYPGWMAKCFAKSGQLLCFFGIVVLFSHVRMDTRGQNK